MARLGILLAGACGLLAVAAAGIAGSQALGTEATTHIRQPFIPRPEKGHVDLSKGGEVRYAFGGKDFKAFKPYIVQLRSPKGVNPLRGNVADHIHHHGLMFAVAIDGVDFWSETKVCGKQFQRELQAKGDILESVIDAKIDWMKADGNTVAATEMRTIAMYFGRIALPNHPSVPDFNYTIASWRTQLAPPAGAESIKLTGSHYFGLGMRFVKSMDNASTFTFADPNAKGLTVRGDEKLTPSAWAACTGAVDGNTVTVAMFDHPDNTRPALWFTMGKPFSYLSATINLWKDPMVVKAGEELDVCYGIAVWDGKATREQIDAAWGHWKKLAPVLKPTAKGKPQGKDKSQ